MRDDDWESEIAEVWARAQAGTHGDDDLRAQIDALAARCPYGDGTADFERGGARDSTGDPEAAVDLYRAALAAGLSGSRRRECAVQLASSLRNLGEVDEAVALLTEERARVHDPLDDAVTAFLALALTSAGRDREAAGLALEALATHLSRYQRSLSAYARELRPEAEG